MTLARTALRLSVVAALKGATRSAGPTIACNRVYDSRIGDFSPETYADDALPTIIVLTDEDDGDSLSRQNGGPPFKRLINLVMEFAMVQALQTEGGFIVGYPDTDSRHEVSLDYLEFQIIRRLGYDPAPMSVLFRSFTRVWKHDCHRQVTDESGVKIAARLLTWQVEVNDDQVEVYNTAGTLPTGYDLLPKPLSTVAKALPDGAEKATCDAIVAVMQGLTVGKLTGLDVTIANDSRGNGDAATNQVSSSIALPQPAVTAAMNFNTPGNPLAGAI